MSEEEKLPLGVWRSNNQKRFTSTIRVGKGRRVYLGTFDTVEEASKAYQEARLDFKDVASRQADSKEAKSPTYEELTKALSESREQLEKEHLYWRETRNANVDLVNKLKRLDCGKHETDKNQYKPDGCLWCRQSELSKENGCQTQEISKLREQVKELEARLKAIALTGKEALERTKDKEAPNER